MQKKISQLKNKIENSNKILLINHKRMDPDAFGSLAGFYYILKDNLQKQVKAVNDDPRPKNFAFLDNNQIFEPKLNLKDFNPDLIISFDAASTDQL